MGYFNYQFLFWMEAWQICPTTPIYRYLLNRKEQVVYHINFFQNFGPKLMMSFVKNDIIFQCSLLFNHIIM